MSNDLKGVPDIYHETCIDLASEGFTEWIYPNSTEFQIGQFCKTTISYVNKRKWYLEEKDPNPIQEELSTWYAKEMTKSQPPPATTFVMKYFSLENDERLLTTNSKCRPVILLRKGISEWLNPSNSQHHIKSWLCLPLFTYKPRHPQELVLNDQRFRHQDRIYIPPQTTKYPGPTNECAARFQTIQMINEIHIEPIKCMCNKYDPKMNRPFKLTNIAIKIILYHFYKSLNIFPELEEPETEYNLFTEQINLLLDSITPL